MSSTVVTGSAAIQNCTVADFSSFSSSLPALCSSREKTSAKERWTKNQVKIKVKYAHLKVPERKKMSVYNGDAWRRHDYRRVNIMHLIVCFNVIYWGHLQVLHRKPEQSAAVPGNTLRSSFTGDRLWQTSSNILPSWNPWVIWQWKSPSTWDLLDLTQNSLPDL